MELSKQIKLLKILGYVYLILLSLTGICQILIGGTLLWDHSAFNEIGKNNFWGPAALIVVMGVFAQLLCWFGWTATRKKNICYLALFNALLIGLLAAQCFTCFWSFQLRNTLIPRSVAFETKIDDSFEEFLKKHFRNEILHSWNRLQEIYQCCGVDGPNDYRRGAAAIPWSCCVSSSDPHSTLCSRMYQRGCLGVIIDTIKKFLLHASLTTFIAATIQVVGLFCSIQLIFSLSHDRARDDTDEASMSFRQKLTRPLSGRTRRHHPSLNDDITPDAAQN